MLKSARALTLLSLSLSLPCFGLDNQGINQSYYVTEKGRPVTIKSEIPSAKSGFSTTWSPDEFFYQKDLVDTFGGRYIVMADSRLIHTIDAQGNMYKSITHYADSKVKIKGAQYFITRNGSLYVTLNDGSLVSYQSEGYQEKFIKVRKSRAAGMFFFMEGNIVAPNPFNGRLEIIAEDPKGDIEIKGHNYFVTDENEFYCVGYRITEKGKYSPKLIKDTLPSYITNITLSGGNFFFDQDNNLYAISDDARFKVRGKVPGKTNELPVEVGGNYMIYQDGSLYQVDEEAKLNFVQIVKDRILTTNK